MTFLQIIGFLNVPSISTALFLVRFFEQNYISVTMASSYFI